MRYLYLDGPTLELRDEPKLTLQQTQTLLGGYMEQVWSTTPLPGRGQIVVMDNEEGLLLNLPPSVRFPVVYSVGGVLRGPVIIMALDDDGDQADMTDEQLAAVTVVAGVGEPFPTLTIRDT